MSAAGKDADLKPRALPLTFGNCVLRRPEGFDGIIIDVADGQIQFVLDNEEGFVITTAHAAEICNQNDFTSKPVFDTDKIIIQIDDILQYDPAHLIVCETCITNLLTELEATTMANDNYPLWPAPDP